MACDRHNLRMTGLHRQHGFSLIEALIFIVTLGVAAAAILGVFAQAGGDAGRLHSRFVAQRIAQSYLQEVMARPARCGSLTPGDGPGPEAGETRASPYDNVNDYQGYDSALAGGIRFPSGQAVDIDADGQADLSGYRLRIAVTPYAYAGVPAADGLLVSVSVRTPTGEDVRLNGLRLCYRS